MPRFLIERTYTVDLDTLPTVSTRSKAIGHHRFPEIVWEHSHVVVTDDGTPKSYCIYAAPTEEMVREHSRLLGDHIIEQIYEIAGDVAPSDFPLTEDPVTAS
jgi:Nickel responsive protein SCO4226-like